MPFSIKWQICPTTRCASCWPAVTAKPICFRRIAWNLFGNTKPGWARVQAICDWVHNHIVFSYPNARCTRTAYEAYTEQSGVCRDFTHLSVAFCRCMNIPARYCTGYLSDVGVPPPYTAMDFAAWFEAYIGGAWHMFDHRNNTPAPGPDRDGEGPRRGGRGDRDDVRPALSGKLSGLYRRNLTAVAARRATKRTRGESQSRLAALQNRASLASADGHLRFTKRTRRPQMGRDNQLLLCSAFLQNEPASLEWAGNVRFLQNELPTLQWEKNPGGRVRFCF